MSAHNVTTLLEEAGYAPSMMGEGFANAVWLANAVSHTISDVIWRAQFVADAAADLSRLGGRPFERLAEEAQSLAEVAEDKDSSPCGSTELWGTLMSYVQK